ncbi:MAG: 4'-phosphopantetheinyl transferase superfamily protein [Elusimicrobia bacterium]|nr:4'-phosphopantetheinyl transferase superfamily protein [Elusimicrobiota bacterium]
MIFTEVIRLDSLPPADEILSEGEMAVYNGFSNPKRRRDWLGGRFALKTAAQNALPKFSLKDIIILNDDDRKPFILAGGEKLPLPVSIAHSGDYAVGVLAGSKYCAVGADLEKFEHRPASWAKDSFNDCEAVDNSPKFLTALWTQKEAALKLLGLGLSADLRDVIVENGSVKFYGAAKNAWEKKHRAPLIMQTNERPQGYMFSIAVTEAKWTI